MNMTKNRFKQIWKYIMGGPKHPTTAVDRGSSKQLRDEIKKASDEGQSLAIKDREPSFSNDTKEQKLSPQLIRDVFSTIDESDLTNQTSKSDD